ncbi:hypothetical protein JZ751_012901 [Albula glossodonta]|uniref:non-specific serine/threonine protein kinase n=1 Tax=Albula glossodonta TaxID=121402 RepID=A0A8T2MRM1_9TELE|nr:hypothetical protein JZ751_012901 [Albula glossodonta]
MAIKNKNQPGSLTGPKKKDTSKDRPRSTQKNGPASVAAGSGSGFGFVPGDFSSPSEPLAKWEMILLQQFLIQSSITPHAIVVLPKTDGMEVLLCYEDEGVYVNTYGRITKDVVLQWGEMPTSVGRSPCHATLLISPFSPAGPSRFCRREAPPTRTHARPPPSTPPQPHPNTPPPAPFTETQTPSQVVSDKG